MNREKEKILAKVKTYLDKYKGDDSIYYKQLESSYEEYQKLELSDKVTNDLFIKHLNELCDFIKSRKHANRTIMVLVIFSCFIIGLSLFSTFKYYNLSTDLKKNILKHNGSTSLNLVFNNTLNFNANTLSDRESYMNLEPLEFTLIASNKDNDDVEVHYDVYLVEDNGDLPEDKILSKDAFLYNVSSDSKESGVKALKDATVKDKKMLIFSGKTKTNEEEKIDLRMWIDSNTNLDYINKKYKFKIYVDGYVI